MSSVASRWVRMATHVLSGPVRQIQVVDGSVWALVGERGAADLYVLRDGEAAAWQRVNAPAGPWVALRGEPGGSRLLALRADPPALLLLDSAAGVQRTWPLPPAKEWRGAAWFPVA